MKFEKIIIYHPSKYLGGTEILFSRVIDVLLGASFKEIIVVDYNNGILSANLKKNGVTYYNVRDVEWIKCVSSSLVLASARNINRLFDTIGSVTNVHVFFWLLHPSELYSGYCIGSTGIKKKLGYPLLKSYLNLLPGFRMFSRNIEYLISHNNLWFMDESCKAESEWALDIKIASNTILPLVTNLEVNSAFNDCSEYHSDLTYKLLVISRLDDFKVYSIYKLLKDLKRLEQENRTFELHLIGDGEHRDSLIDECGKINNIKLVFHGYMQNDMLNDFLTQNHFDLLFAMGTAALEGASRGIPTVLLAATNSPIVNRNDVYKYIDRQKSISLGEYLDTPFENINGMTLEDVIYLNDREHDILKKNVINFFTLNYSYNITRNNFLRTLESINCINLERLETSFLSKIYIKFINMKRIRSGI